MYNTRSTFAGGFPEREERGAVLCAACRLIWSPMGSEDSDPAQEPGPQPWPRCHALLLHLSAGVPQANILSLSFKEFALLFLRGKGDLRKRTAGTPAPSTPSPWIRVPAPPLPTHSTAGDLRWSQIPVFIWARAEVATCKRRGRRQGFPTPDPSLGGLTHSTLPSAAPGTGTLAWAVWGLGGS